jgi:hypothetical protein
MMRRLILMALGLAVWPMLAQAQSSMSGLPAGSAGAAMIEEAAACLLPCGNGARGTLADDAERGRFRQCVLRRLCAAGGTGSSPPVARPSLPVARELPEDLRTRPLDIMRGVRAPGRF